MGPLGYEPNALTAAPIRFTSYMCLSRAFISKQHWSETKSVQKKKLQRRESNPGHLRDRQVY